MLIGRSWDWIAQLMNSLLEHKIGEGIDVKLFNSYELMKVGGASERGINTQSTVDTNYEWVDSCEAFEGTCASNMGVERYDSGGGKCMIEFVKII